MRIAMVGPFGFHPNKTMRSRALQLARPLVKRGHAVKLFMPPWQTPEEAGRQWLVDGVQVSYTKLGASFFGTATILTRETLDWKPDVVHSFKPKAYSGLVAWWLWTFPRRRIGLVTDTDDWEGWGGWNDLAPYNAGQKHFFAWQERWGLKHCHALTVASRTLQSLAWTNGVPVEQVVYLPNGPGIGSDASQAKQKRRELELDGRPVVLLYSRLFEFDISRLTAILQRIRAAVTNVTILSVGASLYEDDAAEFRSALVASGLEDVVLDVGWVEEEELPSLLAAADVGIYLMEDTLLNRTKCPVKLADMLQIGLPVVAERVGQVPEYVLHGQTGLLRSSGDIEGLAADLVHLLKNPRERARLAEKARSHIRANFSWDRLSLIAEQAYQSG